MKAHVLYKPGCSGESALYLLLWEERERHVSTAGHKENPSDSRQIWRKKWHKWKIRSPAAS